MSDKKDAPLPEVGIARVGVPYGLLRRRIEPGYVLTNGTVLLECEKDTLGRYQGGAGMDGMYIKIPEFYIPIFSENGQIKAFQQVAPENYLAAAEMSAEGNYNQIDGMINNEMPKTSVIDNLKQCRAESHAASTTPRHESER